MVVAILIGFQYNRGERDTLISPIDSITGTIVDLYRANRFCQLLNYQIYLFSDIEKVNLPDHISGEVSDGDLDLKVMSFMRNKDSYTLIQNEKQLRIEINKIPEIKDQALFYFTGHGEISDIIMPSNNRMPALDYRDLLLSRCSSKCEILWLLDCCHPNSLNLPFKIQKDNSQQYLIGSEIFSQDIILITSSNEDQKSLSTQYGSLFTKFFFQIANVFTNDNIISWPSRNLIEIKKDINLKLYNKSTEFENISYSQNISLYFSQPGKVLLPLWLSKMSYCFNFDSLHNIITIKEKNKS